MTWWSGGDSPSCWGEPEAERAETGDVGGSGEEVEVGIHFQSAAYACSAPPVPTAHQVGELAFDFGAHRPIVGFPGRAGLLLAGLSEGRLVAPDVDRAPRRRRGAGGAQRARSARLGEPGYP